MFKGIQKVSLIDFPNVICSVLFTGGCNFRCPWCHNVNLVDPESLRLIPDMDESEIEVFLMSRKGKIRGVCVTGGEPTLWNDRLLTFLEWCKSSGLLTKLDTNGSNPEVLQQAYGAKLLDYVAMDIKNSFEMYPQTVGLSAIDVEALLRSIEIIRASKIAHQFRTTVVPGIVEESAVTAMEAFTGEPIVRQKYRAPV